MLLGVVCCFCAGTFVLIWDVVLMVCDQKEWLSFSFNPYSLGVHLLSPRSVYMRKARHGSCPWRASLVGGEELGLEGERSGELKVTPFSRYVLRAVDSSTMVDGVEEVVDIQLQAQCL